ncbi:MAG TPA: glycosyl hydrolase [Abditibacteriaceae bacterium]|jgi:hypothetical protein
MKSVIAPSLDHAEFLSPGAEPRIAPFWFWNCAMSEELVRLQVQQMAHAGIGGFFIHARQGLTLPYLSDEWFARVRVAVEAARAAGIEAWLYDEYPYPSGIAGGLVTANHPEFRERTLQRRSFDVRGGQAVREEMPLGRLVSALAYPVENGKVLWEGAIDVRSKCGVVLTRQQFWLWPMAHIPYNEKRFMADEGRLVLTWTPPPGEWRIFAGIETEARGFKYYDCFFDPLQPGATEEFIRLTHDRYAETVGEYFGSTIPGIFTDETEPPAWSPVIEAEFGLDLAQLLPALHHDDHPRATEVRLRFRECALRLFQERWEAPIARWCAAHNLVWTAEKPTYRPAQFLAIAQPATDAGHRRLGAGPENLESAMLRANHRAAMAAAEQSGTEKVRCECFHSMGWGATLQDQKWQIDWLAVQGVNRFSPHAFYATSSGLTKHDAAPSFFTETPAWKHFHLLADYAARLSLAMSSGHEHARIAVLYPAESLWARDEHSREAMKDCDWLMNTLLAEHLMFHPVDALALLRAEAGPGSLRLGHTRYEVLLVPPLSVITPQTEQAIGAAIAAGMKVMMAEPLGNAANDVMTSPGVTPIFDRTLWISHLEPHRVVSLQNSEGNEAHGLWMLHRETEEQHLLFIANTEDKAIEAVVEISVDAVAWEHWCLENGSSVPLGVTAEEDRVRWTHRFEPLGSALFVARKLRDNTARIEAVAQESVLPLATEGEWSITLDRPNALRLNRWRIVCDGDDWADANRDDNHLAEVEALPLQYLDQRVKEVRQQCEREGETTVWYRRHVLCEIVPDNLALLIENGAIDGEWELFINGVSVERDAFSAIEYHGADKIACSVAHLFQRGKNTLALRVGAAPLWGGLRTPLHLLGDFALGGTDNRTLVSLPDTSRFNDLVAAGFPHFSGAVTYRKVLPSSAFAGYTAIALPAGFTDIAQVKVGDVVLGVRAWSPYQWKLPVERGETIALEIEVTNTLLPFVEGQIWHVQTQKPHKV